MEYQEYSDIICQRLARILNERNISMRSFSFRIGKSGDYIQKLIIGEIKELKMSVLIDICNELHISVVDLINLSNDVPSQYFSLVNSLRECTPEQLDIFVQLLDQMKK